MASSSIIPPTYTPVSQTPGIDTASPTHGSGQQFQTPGVSTPSFGGGGQPAPVVPQFGQGDSHASFYFSNLSFTGTLSRTFHVFFEHWRVLVPIATVVLVPLIVISVTFTVWFVESILEIKREGYEYKPHHLHLLYFMLIVQALLYGIVTVWGRGAMIRAVAEIYSGKIPDNNMWKSCMRHVWVSGQLKPLVTSSIIIFGGLAATGLVPYVLLIIEGAVKNSAFSFIAFTVAMMWGVFAMFAYSLFILASPVICVESISDPMVAIRRSREIVTGTHCYVFLALLVLWILNQIATNISSAVFLGGKHDGSLPSAAMAIVTSFEGILVALVPRLVFFPLHTILEIVMYINIRVQRESLDRDTFVRELEEQDRPTSDIASRYGSTTLNMEGMWKSMAGVTGTAEPSTDYRQVPLMEGENSQQQFV